MTALDDLTAAVTALAATASSLSTAVTELVVELAEAQSDNSTQLESITTTLQGVNTTLTNVLASIPQPAPAATQAFDPVTNLALYSYEGTAPVDATVWTAVNDVTANDGETLYTYSGDSPGAAPTGAVAGEWVPYTGTLTPVG